MKKTRNFVKTISLFLSVMICIMLSGSIMPVAVKADDGWQAPLWVGGKQVTSTYTSNNEQGWSFSGNASGGTLTLNNNASIPAGKVEVSTNEFFCIRTKNNFNLTVSLNNGTSTLCGDASDFSHGIESVGTLTIQGPGTLNINDVKFGIGVNGNLTVKDNTAITAESIEYSGIGLNGNFKIENSTFTALDAGENGIFETNSNNSIEIINSVVNVKGGQNGIWSIGSLSISGSSYVSAEGGTAGIRSSKGLTLNLADGFEVTTPAEYEFKDKCVYAKGENSPAKTVVIRKLNEMKWLDGDDSVLYSKFYRDGEKEPTLPDDKKPEKAATPKYSYIFTVWDSGTYDGENLTMTYRPLFQETVNKYKITFYNEDGSSVLQGPDEYDYGTSADSIVKPSDPEKAETDEYIYTFAGWDPEVAEVTKAADYKAKFNSTKKIKASEVTADDVTAVYDAKPHGIEVNTAISGAIVKYGTEEGTYDLDESPAITNVSESPLKVFYEVTADNCDTYTGSATVTIEPKSITGAEVVLENDSLEYTGEEQSVTVKSVILSDGTELTADDYDVSGNTGTDAGSYTLTVTGKGNYEGEAEAGWTIEEEPEEEDTTETEEEPTEPEEDPEDEEPTEPEEEPEEENPTEPENPAEPTIDPEEPDTDPVINPPAPDYYIVVSYPWKTDEGWVLYPSGWYYYDVYGRSVTGWLRDGGYWYFLDDTGLMQTGWVYNNWNWYYLYPSGAMATGWVYDGNAWYYMDISGKMQTGWIYDGVNWYYLDMNTGAMATGWIYDGVNWYYLDLNTGAMVTGEVLIDDILYVFDETGAWVG